MSRISSTTEPIPGYTVKQRIGVGGYGEVWSAQAPGGLAKAMKFVYGHFDDERAARELKALNRIKEVRHPFLLSLERFEIVEGQLIIVTELADMSLKDRFEQCKSEGLEHIPREELLGYLRDAADALDYMSAQYSLQHLDVKPENLLLVGGRIKVADFGLVKELHDVTASIMGGLTPVYAPPEAFDGRPSQRSDQYSLAIVYQEMLTGVLPFPGRTAAQLASQHLHARPRLAPLPADDQPIIARALSKDPAQRFESCRAMVDCLSGADQAAGHRQGPADQRNGRSMSTSETTPIRSRALSTDVDWQRAAGPAKQSSAARTPDRKTQVLGGEGAAPWSTEKTTSVPPPLVPLEPAVELPPLDQVPAETELRPTLFLGIGGTARQTLCQLRRMLSDRLGPAKSLPAIGMLLLDTDARSTYQATQGDREAALADHETLAMPLRSAQDYTSDGANSFQWLSRRWLYNVPRSLKTEGRRPLGRLAMVDHAQQVFTRLQKAVSDVVRPEAIATSSEAAGIPFAAASPRIFVIASVSGGTGSGTVLDVAYAVRLMLANLSLSPECVCGVLTHSTDRNPSAADLAVANAYACLSELHHFSGPGIYPGERACGLPPAEADTPPFPTAYFVHLGNNLNDQEFERATNELATYLYLSTVPPTAPVFEQCRKLTSDEAAPGLLRTFGLACVGGSHTSLPELASGLLCKQVLERWRGTHQEAAEQPTTSSLVDLATQQGRGEKRPHESNIDRLAEEHAGQLPLTFEQLQQQVRAVLEQELGGNEQSVFARLRAGTAEQRPKSDHGSQAYLLRTLRTINNVFGAATDDEQPVKPAPATLQGNFELLLKQHATPVGDAIRQWIVSLVERFDARVGGAMRAKDWYMGYLRGLEARNAELLHQSQHELQIVAPRLYELATPAAARKGIFGARLASHTAAEVDAALMLHLQIRFRETASLGLLKLVRTIASKVSSAGELLGDFQRELGQLSRQFAGEAAWDEGGAEPGTNGVIAAARACAAEALRGQLPALAQVVDERLQAQFLEPQGGLCQVLQKADAMRSDLMAALGTEARAEVIRALRGASISPTLFGGGDAEGSQQPLQACLELARPRLPACGGAQRAVVIVPESAADSELPGAAAHLSDPPPTVVSYPDGDLIVCTEVQELSIACVAARLTDGRDDFAQIAERLHTRSDVTWSRLPQFAVPHELECAAS